MDAIDRATVVLLAMAEAKGAPVDKELTISIQIQDDKTNVMYYFSSMTERLIFWPDEVNISLLVNDLVGGDNIAVKGIYAGM